MEDADNMHGLGPCRFGDHAAVTMQLWSLLPLTLCLYPYHLCFSIDEVWYLSK